MATRSYRRRRCPVKAEAPRDAARAALVAFLGLMAATAASQPLAAMAGGTSSLDSVAGAVVGLLVLIVLNGLYIAAETAIDLLRHSHVKHVREEQGARSERIQDLIDGRQKYITASLLASRLARLGLLLVVLSVAPLAAAGAQSSLPPDYPEILLWALIIGIPVVFVNLLVGELVPRSFATLHPHRVAISLYGLIRLAAFLLSVPATLITALANVFTARFGGKAAFGAVNVTEDEIKILAESAEETGEIESDERELIHSVFEFNDRVAKEIMTPRVDLDALPVSSATQEVVKLIEQSGHSRIPLYEETDDQIVGIVHAKDLLLGLASGKPLVLRSLMRPPLFVPEGKSLHELLQELRVSRSQLAIVQDEFGGTAGIVTAEDVVEELVGEIVDEYDEEEQSLTRAGDSWLVSGKMHVDEVNDALGSEFETDEFDTIGGLVFGHFGRQPKPDEKLDIDGYEFTVEETDGRRISRLRIHLRNPTEHGDVVEAS